MIGAHDTKLDFADFHSITYSSWWQHSRIRCKIGRCSTLNVKDSLRWYVGKSVQFENTWVWSTQHIMRLYEMEILQKKSPTIEKMNTMVRNSITKLSRQRWENWTKSSGHESKEINRRWERMYLLPMIRNKPVFANRKMKFPPRDPRSFAKTWTHSTTPSSPIVSRGGSVTKKRSLRSKGNRGSILRQPCKTLWNVVARERLVNSGVRTSAILEKKVVIWRLISVSALMNNWKAEKELHLKEEEKKWQEFFSFCEKCIAIGWCNSRFRCNRYSR